MDALVQEFIDTEVAKGIAKNKSLAAVGAAKLAETKGDTLSADAAWATVAEQGMKEGIEGQLHQKLQELADTYVESNPNQFLSFITLGNPDRLEDLVALIDAMRSRGLLEEATKLTMFERHHFERQHIGSRVQAQLRLGRGGNN